MNQVDYGMSEGQSMDQLPANSQPVHPEEQARISSSILIVEDETDISFAIRDILQNQGHRVWCASTLAQARAQLKSSLNLILLDWNLPDGEGISLIHEIRRNVRLAHLPILMITGRQQTEEKVDGFSSGADDYLTKPFDERELNARVTALLRRSRQDRDASPLTGLPGNSRIQEEVEKRLSLGQDFDAIYCDIDRFKAFNDRYGFARGDEAILLLGDCMIEAAKPEEFVGHIGGDDFVALLDVERGKTYAQQVVESFKSQARALHDSKDQEQGFFEGRDRQDGALNLPLLSVTAVVVSTAVRRVQHYAELAQAAAELKSAARKAGTAIRSEQRIDGSKP